MNANPLTALLNQFACQQKFTPGRIRKNFQELETQANHLLDSVSKLPKGRLINDQNEKTQLKGKIEKIQTILSEYKNSIEMQLEKPPQNVIDPNLNYLEASDKLKELSENDKLGYKHLSELLQILTRNCEDATKLPDDSRILSWVVKLKEASEKAKEKITKNKEYLEKIFDKAFDQCEKLKSKLELQKDPVDLNHEITKSLVSRILRLISANRLPNILKDSFNKDPLLTKKYEDLKSAWATSYLTFTSLEALIDGKFMDLTLRPEITAFSNQIKIQTPYFTDLNLSLDKLSPNVLAKGFHKVLELNKTLQPPAYKRDFSQFFEDMEKYSRQKRGFEKYDTDFNVLEKSKEELDKKIESSFDELSKILEKLKNQKHFKNLIETCKDVSIETEKNTDAFSIPPIKSFSDENINMLFPIVFERISKHFKSFRNDIEIEWKECCSNFEKLKHQKTLYNKFKEIIENQGICYFLTEDLYGSFRTLRLDVDDQAVHVTDWGTNIKDLKILYNLTSDKFYQDVVKEKISSPQCNRLLDLLGKNENELHFTLSTDYQALSKGLMEDSLKMLADDPVDTPEKTYIQEFIDRMKNTGLAFKKLSDICTSTFKGVERERKALQWFGNNPSYKDCFKTAYNKENSTVDAIQTAGSMAKSVLSSSIGVVSRIWSSPEEKSELKFDEVVKSPFENNEILKELIERTEQKI
jgi:hypothetical protein